MAPKRKAPVLNKRHSAGPRHPASPHKPPPASVQALTPALEPPSPAAPRTAVVDRLSFTDARLKALALVFTEFGAEVDAMLGHGEVESLIRGMGFDPTLTDMQSLWDLIDTEAEGAIALEKLRTLEVNGESPLFETVTRRASVIVAGSSAGGTAHGTVPQDQPAAAGREAPEVQPRRMPCDVVVGHAPPPPPPCPRASLNLLSSLDLVTMSPPPPPALRWSAP